VQGPSTVGPLVKLGEEELAREALFTSKCSTEAGHVGASASQIHEQAKVLAETLVVIRVKDQGEGSGLGPLTWAHATDG
jgi:hypothetical protein